MANSLWDHFPQPFGTTGIGSLPHPYVDAALSVAFRPSIPFLPQLPAKNEKEFMVVQALEGLPGLSGDETGLPHIDWDEWKAGTAALRERTDKAFDQAANEQSAFEFFEPSVDRWSAWNPFLFELEERGLHAAKIQLAGPLTCQWAIQKPDRGAEENSELALQVYRLVLAKSLAMVRRMNLHGITPLLVLDEPGFYSFSSNDPLHTLRFQELKLFIQTLKKEKVLVGLHCCSNTDWDALLGLPLDMLSVDTQLSLENILSKGSAVQSFLDAGGRFSLGVVPTSVQPIKIQSFEVERAVESVLETVRRHKADDRFLKTALFTPACGLALHAVGDANRVLDATLRFADELKKRLG